MGGTASKLRKHLQKGDELAALQLYERHPELRKSFDPNLSYGEEHGQNTPLHYTAKYAMLSLVRSFLTDFGGNPNKKNADECTALMLICQGGTSPNRTLDAKIRADCLSLMLNWQGPEIACSESEKIDMNALDLKKNTTLHYAASSGLHRCVEMLISHGAKIFENESKETAGDLADKFGFGEIAEYLELKTNESVADDLNAEDRCPIVERFSGLAEQDLMEAKDLLLVETSDMLQVPLFTAEALLRNHEWSREALWLAWSRDPIACCEKARVQLPALCPVDSDVGQRQRISPGQVDNVEFAAFVETNPRIKWCPFPGCSNAVHLSDMDEILPIYRRAFPKLQPPPSTSRSVYCPQGHSYCWECLDEGHEPTSCEKWKEWHTRIVAVKPEELHDAAVDSESAANCLWLMTNSKPCPKCRSPIQKNEGCNHIKCSKCKHDFCWVCLGPWKRHGVDTGGYFQCNRFDNSRKLEKQLESTLFEASEQNRKAQELSRFVHYYSRYRNHLNICAIETTVRNSLEGKVVMLIGKAPATLCGNGNVGELSPADFSFVFEAMQQLLRSRKVLSSSYAYGYFLKDCGYNKTIFECLQNQLEVSVESLSSLVGRKYLRGSSRQIELATQLVASEKQRFLLCINRGLLPPETPSAFSKTITRELPAMLGLDKHDDDWADCTLLPIDSLDQFRPWVKDSRSTHHNLMSILEWSQSNDDQPDDKNGQNGHFGPSNANDVCSLSACNHRRANNLRTGDLHPFCSLKGRYLATDDVGIILLINILLGCPISNVIDHPIRPNRPFNVDLMISLQMSRLQLLHDLKAMSNDDSDCDDTPSSSQTQTKVDSDLDLQMAIEMSMTDLVGTSASIDQLIKSIDKKVDRNSVNDDGDQLKMAVELVKCDKVLLKNPAKKDDKHKEC